MQHTSLVINMDLKLSPYEDKKKKKKDIHFEVEI